MSKNFFATDDDFLMVLRWLLEVPDMRILEENSEPDRDNRWFGRLDELATYMKVNPYPVLSAWSPSLGGAPITRTITFTEKVQREPGATGRTVISSPAFINLRRLGVIRGCLAASSIACWSEKGARQRLDCGDEYLTAVNWKKLISIVRAVERRIYKASPAKINSQPIMPVAFEKYRSGEIAFWNWGTEIRYPSPIVTLT